MFRSVPRVMLATVAVLVATCASAVAATIPSRGYFNSNGLYDCEVFQPALGNFGEWTTVDSLKFSPNGTYQVASVRVGRQLKPPITTGGYKLSGSKIIPSSGLFKKLGEYVLIEKTDLHVYKNNGHLTALTCELRYPKPPIVPKPIPLSTFTCAETEQESNAITDQSYYISQVVDHVTFYNNNTYLIGLSIPGGWHVSGNKIVFTSGPWWTYAQHNLGLAYPSGITMPHAAYPLDPTTLYTLVIKDTVQEGGIPPSQEFSSTDGPNGTSSLPVSFYYCKTS